VKRSLAIAAIATLVSACGSSQQAYHPPTTGPAIYRADCATCHGAHGEGFEGPTLRGVAQRYPNENDQIALVSNGRGQMPSWAGQLTPAQIQAVVDYTRTAFDNTPATQPPVGPPRPTGR
jgi:mono/diheme cytochrome c family protein